MLNRFVVSLSLALMAGFALTGAADAAVGPDAEEVAAWTGAVVIGMMVVLSLIYAVKAWIGFDHHSPTYELGGAAPHADDHHAAADDHAADDHHAAPAAAHGAPAHH